MVAEVAVEAEEVEVEAEEGDSPWDGALFPLHPLNKQTTGYTVYLQTPSSEPTQKSRTSSLSGRDIGASITTIH